MSGAGPAALVVSLALALISGLAAIIVVLLRSNRSSPESRDSSTAAFTAVTTGQTALNTQLQARNTQLQTWRDWIVGVRIPELLAWGRSGQGGDPPPPATPEPPT